MSDTTPTIEEIKGAAIRLHSRWYLTLLGGIAMLLFWVVLFAITAGSTSSTGGMFRALILLIGIGLIIRGIISMLTAKALWVSKDWLLLSAWGKVVAWKKTTDVSLESWEYKVSDGFSISSMLFGCDGLGLMMQTREKEKPIWVDHFSFKKLLAAFSEKAAEDSIPQGVLMYVGKDKRTPFFFRHEDILTLCTPEGKIVRGEQDGAAWFRIRDKKMMIRRKNAGLLISKTKPKKLAVDEEGEVSGLEFKVSTSEFVYRGL